MPNRSKRSMVAAFLKTKNKIVNFNRSFEQPTKSQIDYFKQAITRFGSKLEKSEIRHLEFFIKGF